VLVEFGEGLGATTSAPKQKLVIIASRGQLLVVKGPFKAADFLTVTDELCRVVGWAA